MHTTKTIVVLAVCLAAVQAGAIIGRKSVESKDSVEVKDNGISVKSGYEGYITNPLNALVPDERKDNWGWLSSSQLDVLKAMIMYKSSFLPMIGLKIVKVLLHFALALFIGLASTTAVCSFTPLCNISFQGSKPSLLSDKMDILPALKEALEVVARIPNVWKRDESPAQLQPEQPLGVAESTPEESSQRIIDPRNPRKNLDDESQSSKTEQVDVKESES